MRLQFHLLCHTFPLLLRARTDERVSEDDMVDSVETNTLYLSHRGGKPCEPTNGKSNQTQGHVTAQGHIISDGR